MGFASVVDTGICDDARARRVGRSNLRLAVQKTIRLKEICRLSHVGEE